MCSALSAVLAMVRAAQRAMHYASSPRRSRAAVLVPSRCQPAVPIASLSPLTETTRRQPAVARAGERSSWSSGGVFGARRRRRALFFASADGPRTADLPGSPQCPSGLGPHRACAVGRTRRRPDAVAAWPLLVGPRRGNRAEPQVTGGHSQPSVRTPSGPGDTAGRRRVDESCTQQKGTAKKGVR